MYGCLPKQREVNAPSVQLSDLMRKRLQRPRNSGFSKHPQQMLTAGDGGRCYVWIEHESLPESHQAWGYFQARLAFTMAAFNVLVQWHVLRPNASGFVPLSIAEFSL
jgi:hypothetical protein